MSHTRARPRFKTARFALDGPVDQRNTTEIGEPKYEMVGCCGRLNAGRAGASR